MSPVVNDLMAFLDASVSPYHAVGQCVECLTAAGFTPLSESDTWTIKPGGAYYVIRGGKTIIAWRQGTQSPTTAGFRIVAAHTDSPVLKLRPNPALNERSGGYLTTEIYGSPLMNTWLDRDLILSGAAFFKDKNDTLHQTPIDLPDTKVRAISLAPHLRRQRQSAEPGLVINPHTDLPVIMTSDGPGVADTLNALFASLSKDFGQLVSHDVFLADSQPGALIGANNEFISSPRLDNLYSSYCGLKGLIDAPADCAQTAMVALYDAEEIGSRTWSGAQSNVLEAVLTRLVPAKKGTSDTSEVLRAKANSILISADMAHGEHPSYKGHTDPEHVPVLNQGMALKAGARGNYAIGPRADAWFRCVLGDLDLNLQTFMYRCDHGAGSSVGPLVSTGVGIESVDVGTPMLAMHSIREMAGAHDVEPGVAAFRGVFASDRPFPPQ